jgi:uncharacterized membrane protein HdeD (DUF308 family)
VSDISMPDTGAGTLSRTAVRGLTGSWWLLLVLGILWILFGMLVLTYNIGSLLALAVFFAVTFLMTGVTQLLAAGRAEGWRWLWVVGIYAVAYGLAELFGAVTPRQPTTGPTGRTRWGGSTR